MIVRLKLKRPGFRLGRLAVALVIVLTVYGVVLWAQQPVAQGPQAPNAAAWLVSVTSWAGSTLGAISTYGTSPGAVIVPAVNAFVTNTITATISGTVAVSFSPVATSGGATSSFDVTSSAATQVKATSGNVYGFYVFNPNNTVCYLQFYNSAAATLGTGALHPIGVQSGVTVEVPVGAIAAFNFATAISTGETTTPTGATQCTTPMTATISYQ